MAEILQINLQPKQTEFLGSRADIVIGGGSAGGGKTIALTFEPTRWLNKKGFTSVFLRRSYPEITKPGGAWDEAGNWYPQMGGVPNLGRLEYKFYNNVRFSYGHLQAEQTLNDWKSSQIPLIMFDQLETFTERMFFYMLSRNRSNVGIYSYMRCTANPAPNWLADLLDWWIADDGYADLDRIGKLRAFARMGDEIEWADTKDELIDKYSDLADPPVPKTLTFIPFTIYDNPILLEKDPTYISSLQALPFVDRERLLGDRVRGGNWHIKESAGKVFNEEWFTVMKEDAIPTEGIEVRYFDTAATLKQITSNDPDFTAGVKIRYHNGRVYVMDVINRRVDPAMFYQLIRDVGINDYQSAREKRLRYMLRWEEEPGSASKRESYTLVTSMQGIDCKGVRKNVNKLQAWKPLAAQALAGNVILCEGGWNKLFINQMHGVPDLPHDDIADAVSGAYNEVVKEYNSVGVTSHQG